MQPVNFRCPSFHTLFSTSKGLAIQGPTPQIGCAVGCLTLGTEQCHASTDTYLLLCRASWDELVTSLGLVGQSLQCPLPPVPVVLLPRREQAGMARQYHQYSHPIQYLQSRAMSPPCRSRFVNLFLSSFSRWPS